MKIKLICIIVIFLFTTLPMVGAKPKVLLRLNLEKGDHYQMTMTSDNNVDQEMMGQQMKIHQMMEFAMSYKVLDVLPDKNYVIEYSFDKLKMDMDINGQKMIIDSESTSDDQASKNIIEMTSMKLKFTMNSMGKIQSIEGIDGYMNKIAGNPQLTQTLSMFTNEENFKSSFGQYLGYFPEGEVEVGSTWDSSIIMPGLMNMGMNMHYTVNDIINDQIILGVDSNVNIDNPIENNGMKIQMKTTGTQTGTMKVDLKNGFVGTTDINQKFDMKMKFNNPESGEEMEIPMIMNAVTKVDIVKL